MSTISSIVNVNIAVQSQGLTRDAYNICMLLSSTKLFTELYQLYASMADVALVFPPETPEYVCAQTFFSQEPTTTPLMIGRRPADTVTANIAPLLDSTYTYQIFINGQEFSINASAAIYESVIQFNNGATGAVIPFDAGDIINMSVAGVPIAPVTCVGVGATDGAAIAAAMQAAGGASIGTVGFSETSPTTLSFTVPPPATLTQVPVTVENPTVTGGGPWNDTGTILIFSQISAAQMAAMFAYNINTFYAAQSNPLVSASVGTSSASGSSVVVSSVTNEIDGGSPWTFTVDSFISNTLGAAPSSSYTSAYLQVSTESSSGFYSCSINGAVYNYQANLSVIGTATEASQGLYNAIVAGNPPNVAVSYDSDSELIYIESTVTQLPSSTANVNLTYITPFILTTTTPQRVHIISRIYTLNPIATGETSAGVQTDLANIAIQNPNFYAIACTDRTVDVVQGIAAYALSNKLLFGTASSDVNIYLVPAGSDVTSVASLLNASGGDRTFVMYHQDAGSGSTGTGADITPVITPGSYSFSYPEMAWFGRMLNTLPGSQNWALKRLSAILPTVALSTTQIDNIFNKQCNLFSRIAGVPITRWGTLSSGSYIYIDIVRGADWLSTSIQSSVYAALVSTGKIPYTDKGIEVVSSIINQQLQLAIDNGYISDAPLPTVSVPSAAAVPSADKVNRVLNNVTFTATLAGAINKVNINGTLTF